MRAGLSEFVVQGMTMDGAVFQPAGWAQRLFDRVVDTGADVDYAVYMRPGKIDGTESLVVRTELKQVDSKTFNAIKQFVADNHLMVRAGRGVINAENNEPPPHVDRERRDPKRNSW